MKPSAAYVLPLLVSLVSGAPLLSAQSSEVLPAGSEGLLDRNIDAYLGASAANLPVHVQYGYASADLRTSSLTIRKLAWRRCNARVDAVEASSSRMDIYMSHGALAPSAFGSSFAKNHGGDLSKVFSGTVSWPAVPRGGKPAAFTLEVPLNAAFVATPAKGKSLVLEIYLSGRSHKVQNVERALVLDAVAPPVGTRVDNGKTAVPTTCLNSANRYNDNIGFRTTGLTGAGGSWYVSYDGLTPNTAGLTMLSAFGSGDMFGNIQLPIDLSGFGMPKCWFHVGLEGVWIPWTTDAAGAGRLGDLRVPPGLGGVSFYDQGIYLDAGANSRGLVTCWSSKWTISRDQSFDVATVFNLRDSKNDPDGFLRERAAAIVELK